MMDDAFEVRRRSLLFTVLVVAALAVAAGFGWVAVQESNWVLAVPAAVLLVVAGVLVRAVGDYRTPLFVADDHGIRLRAERGWVGLLWSELGELKVERRTGLFHDARIKVVSADGMRVYFSPLGPATNVSVATAEDQLAARRPAGAY
jgi:hypothetical protein